MGMIKYCDRCKEVIHSTQERTYIIKSEKINDLCYECYSSIVKFIEDEML
jgi:hypothetical protein